MKSILVYDVPTRLFHILFAFCFVGAFFIANSFDDESGTFPYHMLIGLTLGFLALLRILWGLFGSKYARFTSFPLHPKHLLAYGKSLISGKTRRYPGHNPASSWAALGMLCCAVGLAITGLLMAQGKENDLLEEVHELLANGFLLLVVLHLVGVFIHQSRHRDGMALSMVNGKKMAIDGESGIKSNHFISGLLFLVLVFGFTSYLIKWYDPGSRNLIIFGSVLQLGETEHHDGHEGDTDHEDREDHEGHDDDDD